MKAVDLMAVLVEAGLLTQDQVAHLPTHIARPPKTGHGPLTVTPTVFSATSHQREADLVSVMMPFDPGFDPTLQSIQQACRQANLRCIRADSLWQASEVIQDIFNLLFRSRIVVVDFTGRNPNVMYETGIAHTLSRQVIPITQSLDDVPFDLRRHRVLKYLPNGEGLVAMQTTLAERLRTLTEAGRR